MLAITTQAGLEINRVACEPPNFTTVVKTAQKGVAEQSLEAQH